MGQDRDPYDDAGGFTPYQPDATPRGESAPEGGAEVPFVPYGGATAHYHAPSPVTTSAGHRLLPWLIGIGVLVATCGGGIAAVVGSLAGSDYGSDAGRTMEEIQAEVLVNNLEARQCLIGAGLDPSSPSFDAGVSGLEVVDCGTAHDAEVIAVNVLDSDEAASYDFDDSNGAFESCEPFFSAEQKKLLRRDDLYLIALTESATPATGDKVACLLTNADGSPLHGSLDVPAPAEPVEPEDPTT